MTKTTTTITINGRQFDAKTGLPVSDVVAHPIQKPIAAPKQPVRPAGASHMDMVRTPSTSRAKVAATNVHQQPAKSQTLRREAVQKPAGEPDIRRIAATRHARVIPNVPLSAQVQHFKPADVETVSLQANSEPVNIPVTQETQLQHFRSANPAMSAPKFGDVKPTAKHHAASATHAQHHPSAASPVSKKEQVIAHQIAQAPTHAEKAESHFDKPRKLRKALLITALIVVVIGAIGFAYLKLPSLSLFIAARSADISATYPTDLPAGFSFHGPISYQDGQVITRFDANGSDQSFTITQQRSGWDSGAVLDNYVLPKSSSYLTYSEKGLTIYTFDSQAAWVSAGILHVISGTASLSTDQILHIASSM